MKESSGGKTKMHHYPMRTSYVVLYGDNLAIALKAGVDFSKCLVFDKEWNSFKNDIFNMKNSYVVVCTRRSMVLSLPLQLRLPWLDICLLCYLIILK
jgi:hypothetical protein